MTRNKLSSHAVHPYIVLSVLTLSLFAMVIDPLVLIALSVLFATLIITTQIGILEKSLKKHQDNLFRQSECRSILESRLNLEHPLPTTRGYRGSPDFLLQVYEQIFELRPKVVVEASSGLSTIVCAAAIKNSGCGGRVYSMEHEHEYASGTRELLERYGLNRIADVFHTPLTEHKIKSSSFRWYDFAQANLPNEIDLIIVDGPPKHTQKHARYPAAPLLIERLNKGGAILVDDTDRKSDSETINMWQKDFPFLNVSRLPMEKGMTILRNT